MPVTIDGSNTPTAGGVVYGDGTEYASTAAGTSGQSLLSAGSSAPTWGTPASATTATNLAGGSAGTVPYQSASGTTAMLAAGTSGQVLTSSGAGAPSWTTPSAGALVYISTQTISSPVTTVDFTSGFSSTYDDYVILCENLVPDGPVSLSTRIYKNSSLVSTSTYNYQRLSVAGASPGGTSNPNVSFSSLSILRTDGFGFGKLEIFNANSTNATFLSYFGQAGTTNTAIYMVAMNNTEAGTFTGIRIYDVSGYNIVSGTFRLYGVAKS